MSFFTAFILNALLFVASALLTPLPKTRDREATPFEEARLPSIDPQKSVQVTWGLIRVTAPHLMGVTEYNTVAIEQKVKTLFKSKDVTIGHRYFVGMYLGCGVGISNLKQIWFGGELLWDSTADGFTSQSATNGDVITINKPEFLGGRENGGGLIGTIRWYRGTTTQIVDPYIASFVDHQPTPAFRFTSYATFINFEVGETPAIDAFEFVTDREPPDHLSLGANLRIDGKATDTEVNPMAIVADLLVNDNFGEGEPLSALNLTKLNTMGDTLAGASELNGMSLKWANEESIARLFKIVADQIQGFIFKKIGTGQWSGNLVRDDFDPDLIRVVDISNAKLRSFSRRNWPETSNQSVVDWNDRDLDRKPTPAVEHDFSNFNRIGRVRAERKTYPGVYSPDLAVQIASRSLKAITFPFANGEFIGDRTFYDAEPGEPMKLVWSPLGIASLIIRAGGIGYGTSDNGSMPISFTEDFFSQALIDFTGLEDAGGAAVNQSPQVITVFYGLEMPYFLQVFDTLIDPALSGVSNTVNKLGWLAKRPQSNSLEWRMYEEAAAGQSVTAQELTEFTPVGELTAELLESTADEGVVITIDTVADAVRMIEDGAAIEATIKATGFGLALFEDDTDEEYVGVTAIVDNGDGTFDITIARGLIDTNPKTWPINSRLWFVSVGMGATFNEHGDADAITYQAENNTTKGIAALSATKERTFTNRSDKPYPVGNLEISDTAPETNKYWTTTLVVGDITLDWEGRDRTNPGILFQNDDDVVEADFEFFLTIYDNTIPASPVVLRRVGRGASGSPGTNEAVTLSGEQYVWTAAKQLADDPGQTIADIRIDLRTLGDTGAQPASLFNHEDVIRSFTRTP